MAQRNEELDDKAVIARLRQRVAELKAELALAHQFSSPVAGSAAHARDAPSEPATPSRKTCAQRSQLNSASTLH